MDVLRISEATLYIEAKQCKKELSVNQEMWAKQKRGFEVDSTEKDHEIAELKVKLELLDAKVAQLIDVNENIELEMIVKIYAELFQQYKEGKAQD